MLGPLPRAGLHLGLSSTLRAAGVSRGHCAGRPRRHGTGTAGGVSDSGAAGEIGAPQVLQNADPSVFSCPIGQMTLMGPP